MITPNRMRLFGLLQSKASMRHSTLLATCTAAAVVALLETMLKRYGGGSLLPPKDILRYCLISLNVTRTAAALLQTRLKPFAGTSAPKQRVALTLNSRCRDCSANSLSNNCKLSSPPLQ